MNLSYIAGLMDGEGSFCLVKRKRNHDKYGETCYITIGLQAKEEEEDILFKMQSFFNGGRIYTDGRVTHWKTTNVEDTIRICNLLIPFLILKKERAENVLKMALRIKSRKK